jgi:ATP-dependent Clp protease ATP-binding subunit ClpB
MTENIFAKRLQAETDEEPVLPPIVLNDEEPDDPTAKMLIIPISQEIAPDFQLIGYDDTIRRIEEVLTQRGKQRNVMLYGENGAGKTALVQGLVQRKNRGDLSTHMFKRMFYRLNSSLLLHMDDVAEINRQFDQALEEFGRYDVMVIENFYTLMTYLKLKGANVVVVGFLEALSRRRLQSIITCNVRERPLVLNEIPDIHEYFSPEKIDEPNDEQLLQILRGVHRSYEDRYGVAIPDSSLCTVRDLTQRYRTGLEGWAQPGRALIVLDRSIAQFSVRMNSKPIELATLESEYANAEYEVQSLTTNDTGQPYNNGKAAERKHVLEKRMAEIAPQIAQMRHQWITTTAPIQELQTEKSDLDKRLHNYLSQRRHLQDLRNDTAALMAQGKDASKVSDDITRCNKMIEMVRGLIRAKDDELSKINLSAERDHCVTSAHIADTYSELSGIPPGTLNQDERERVLKMEDILGDRVFGQPAAIKALANAVRRQRAKLSTEEECPKGTFLFLGPSGVGKTELGRTLSWFETGSVKNLIRLDMSEYKERHSVSRLIGAPPGYAGYDKGGMLTEAVRQKPKSVIMCDEAEKAHEDIWQTFLQVFDGGRLTDGLGVTVDFRETFIILTSNIGARYFLRDDLTFEQAEVEAMKLVREHFAPEFIGRLDGIICFHRLGLPMLTRVAKRRFAEINRSIEPDQRRLVMADPDIDRFCTAYQDPAYGARPILKALKSTLENDLATSILESDRPGVFTATYADKLDVAFVPA